ncbi:MAG: competence/damage-inducible protein A [Verrucomicrobia bacterium]|nr:competence/damage-inducible protein A [Verrucomicrobiota bacterium]
MAAVIIELITTGSELMLGRVLNSHQQWICRQLADAGYSVQRQVAVPDTASAIQQAVAEALTRADWVITTGGLGPTSDDLTREWIARLLGRPLREDAVILAELAAFFARRNRPMPPRTALQALVPEGAAVLPNPNGTAPGLFVALEPNPFRNDNRPAWLVMLPGPPRELRPMFADHVLPRLKGLCPLPVPCACRTLRTVGIGESQVEQLIDEPLRGLIETGLELGYCARPGEVDVRLLARGTGAERMIAQAEQCVRGLIGEHIFGQDDAELDRVVVSLLRERNRTLAVAESCTGGLIAHRVTNVPGASAVFLGGFVAYSNAAKLNLLGVQAATLERHGAVSEATAREMAAGARSRLGADYALAVTGIAGPGGGTAEKPVGTVFIALAAAEHTWILRPKNPFDRATFKFVTSQQALELVRRTLVTENPQSI